MYTGTLAAASNRADFRFTVELIDPDTNASVDLSGASITVAIRPQDTQQVILTGTTSNGKVTLGSSSFSVAFSPADMKTLNAGSYDIGIIALLNTGITHQIIAASLPVVDGVIDP